MVVRDGGEGVFDGCLVGLFSVCFGGERYLDWKILYIDFMTVLY